MKKPDANNPETPAQPPDTTEACNTPTRAKVRRKIDAEVIASMAKAVAKMLTESEAARLCGIEPRHWFEWKSRAGRDIRFAALLEQVRASRINHLLERVEKSADGIDTKFPDFRAALALLKITDQKRFGDSPASVNINAFAPLLTDAQIAKVEALFLKSKAIASAPAPKQIQAAEIVPERVAKNE
jgi:hypothetical protein